MSTYSNKDGQFDSARWIRDFKNKDILSEGPYNDPALKALRLKAKGEMMPKLSQWWEYEPEDVMRFIYWGKGQMAPTDQKVLEKEWANIVKQLHVKYPIPADAEGHLDMATIGEAAGTKPFVPGQMWSNDFDYTGMLKFGAALQWPETGFDNDYVENLLKPLYESFTDVNYHTEAKDLGNAIDWIEDPGQDANRAQEMAENFLESFSAACMKTLKEWGVKFNPDSIDYRR